MIFQVQDLFHGVWQSMLDMEEKQKADFKDTQNLSEQIKKFTDKSSLAVQFSIKLCVKRMI